MRKFSFKHVLLGALAIGLLALIVGVLLFKRPNQVFTLKDGTTIEVVDVSVGDRKLDATEYLFRDKWWNRLPDAIKKQYPGQGRIQSSSMNSWGWGLGRTNQYLNITFRVGNLSTDRINGFGNIESYLANILGEEGWLWECTSQSQNQYISRFSGTNVFTRVSFSNWPRWQKKFDIESQASHRGVIWG
jgi:hypothetical protein